jgi:hypothetical protein
MKKAFKCVLLSVIIAVIHAAALWVVLILAFVGSFGAPQGGDAGYVHQTTGLAATFTRFLEIVARVLWFPASTMAGFKIPVIVLWTANSLLWGFLIVCVSNLVIRKFKKSNRVPVTDH